ncbi:hypothetical protein BgAZ_106760 [Babesia gibsoni]|uniref:Uncharacterized protein n=1 Tax=Babesia gibsoni TaxID=33632 RepID=A0AAD8PGI2_BABGI|nr:hypothetical protein BgAZ_106760 [Babesia gibsoni]
MRSGHPNRSRSSSNKTGKSHSQHKGGKLTPEKQLADELNTVKQLQGYRRKDITGADVDAILNHNARLIETLVQPSLIGSTEEYVEKFAELQRNLVLISRLSDQPK